MISRQKLVSFTSSIVPSVELPSTTMISLGYASSLWIVLTASSIFPASLSVGMTTETNSTFDVMANSHLEGYSVLTSWLNKLFVYSHESFNVSFPTKLFFNRSTQLQHANR